MKFLLLCSLLFSISFAKPNWIENSSNKEYIGGVGIAKNITQKRLAKILARANLLENIKVHLSSTTVLKDNSNSDETTTYISREITQEAEGFLKNSFVKDSFIDDHGFYYVWVVIKR